MKLTRNQYQLLFFLLLLSVLSGCQPNLSEAVKPAGGARFVRFTPAASPTPKPTLTPTEVIIAIPGTPFPTPQVLLEAQNAADLQEIAAWGRGKPQAIALSHDQKQLALATTGGVYLYDTTDLQISAILSEQKLYRSLAYSPDGKFLVAGSDNGRITLWKQGKKQPVAVLDGHDAAVLNLSFSVSGNLLASGSWDNSICVWQISDDISSEDTPRFSIDIDPANGVQALSISETEDEILTWSPPAEVLAIDLNTAETRSIYVGGIPKGTAPTVRFSPGNRVIAIETDRNISLYQGNNGYTLYKLSGFSEDIERMAFSRDGELLAAAGNSHVDIWQVDSGALLRTYDSGDADSRVRDLVFSADGSLLALLGDHIRLLEVNQPDAPAHSSQEHFDSQNLEFIQFLSSGNSLALGWSDSSLNLIDVNDGSLQERFIPKLDEDSIPSATAIDAAGKQGVSADWDGRLFLWHTAGDRSVSDATLQMKEAITSVALTHDGALLAAGAQNGEVTLWQLPESEPALVFDCGALPQSLLFSPDGQSIMIHTARGISLWRIHPTTGTSLSADEVITTASTQGDFSPDSQLLAVSANLNGKRQIRLYHCEDGSPAGHIDSGSEGYLSFSPDGNMLALSGYDLSLWQIDSGELLIRLPSRAPFGRTAFSPDGRLLALASGDGRLQLFAVP